MRPLSRATIQGLPPVLSLVLLAICLVGRVLHDAELEWMEGAMLDVVARLREGEALYPEPSLQAANFVYPPLHYALCAVSSQIFGEGFPALRIPSVLAVLVSMALLFDLGSRRRRDPVAGLWAAALFACAYEACGRWLDLGRVDALHVALLLGFAWMLERGRGTRHAVLTGLVLALAFACKQTTAILVAPVLLSRLLREPRPTLVLGASFLLPTGIAHFWLQQATAGWYGFYVYEVPAAHPWFPGSWLGFWEEDVLLGLPVVFALGLGSALWLGRTARDSGRDLLLLVLGALVASYLSRLHYGGWRNTVLPFWAFAALAGGRGFAELARRPEAGRVLVGVLVLMSAQVLWRIPRPWEAIPGKEHALRWERITEELRALEGPVFLPDHGAVLRRAGHRPCAHTVAIWDLLLTIPELQAQVLPGRESGGSEGGRVVRVARGFLREAREELSGGVFAHLVTDADDLDGKVPGSGWRGGYVLHALLAGAEVGGDERRYAGSVDAPVWPRLVWRRK